MFIAILALVKRVPQMNKIVIQKSQYNDRDTINISEQNINNDVSNTMENPALTAMIKTKM
jgi:hypothetical protein